MRIKSHEGSADMNPELVVFVDQAAAIATSGRWNAVNERIKQLCAHPGAGNEWHVQVLGGLCFQAFSEYHRLKDAFGEKDVPLLAWRARNLLELSVWSMYCGKSRDNARRLYEDAGRDAAGIFEAFTKWGSATGRAANWLDPLADAKRDLTERAAAEGIESLDGPYKQVSDAAKECGIGHHFSVSFKMLSKFAHPTAMRIVTSPDETRTKLQMEQFFSHGCLFFAGAFDALEKQLIRADGES